MHRTALALACLALPVGKAQAADWMIEAHYANRAELADIGARFQHVDVRPETGVVRMVASDAGFDALLAEGYRVDVDLVASAQIQMIEAAFSKASREGRSIKQIPGFACYRSVDEIYALMSDLETGHPGIVRVDDIGPSWRKSQDPGQGHEMQALRITNFATLGSDPGRPKMVAFASIHAREYPPAEILTRFAEWLVQGYGSDPQATWLVDHNDFRLVLLANPDARKIAEVGALWRKNTNQIEGSCDGDPATLSLADGVDLNRNFPFHWNSLNGAGSSSNVCNETYHGPNAGSEPETRNLVRYVAGDCNSAGVCSGGVFTDLRTGPMNPPTPGGDGNAASPADISGLFIDIHNFASVVAWPWGDIAAATGNNAAYRILGQRMAYFGGYRATQISALFPSDGATADTMYGLVGVPSLAIETTATNTGFFENCDSFEAITAPRNLESLRYAARSLKAPFQLPAGPDTVSVDTPVLASGGGSVVITASIESQRYPASPNPPSVSPVASAALYIGGPPWAAAAQPIAMSASDGQFDSPVENVTISVDSSLFSGGGRFVWVQGTDAAGRAGTPNANYIDIPSGEAIFADGFDGAAAAADHRQE